MRSYKLICTLQQILLGSWAGHVEKVVDVINAYTENLTFVRTWRRWDNIKTDLKWLRCDKIHLAQIRTQNRLL
jgi:hypothetical protein